MGGGKVLGITAWSSSPQPIIPKHFPPHHSPPPPLITPTINHLPQSPSHHPTPPHVTLLPKSLKCPSPPLTSSPPHHSGPRRGVQTDGVLVQRWVDSADFFCVCSLLNKPPPPRRPSPARGVDCLCRLGILWCVSNSSCKHDRLRGSDPASNTQ